MESSFVKSKEKKFSSSPSSSSSASSSPSNLREQGWQISSGTGGSCITMIATCTCKSTLRGVEGEGGLTWYISSGTGGQWHHIQKSRGVEECVTLNSLAPVCRPILSTFTPSGAVGVTDAAYLATKSITLSTAGSRLYTNKALVNGVKKV